jgi:predicted ribosomally synthesized peptide with SipW-like signal peptide
MSQSTQILLVGLAIGLLAGLMGTVSLALFTSVMTNPSNDFSTGTVVINTAPSITFISYSDMAPGDKVTAPLTVSNDGTLQLRYAVTSRTTENTLAAQLDMTIKTGVTTCTNAGFGASGTAIYGPGDLGSIAGTNVIGNPAQGFQAGDRTLAPYTNEVLCFQVQLPLSTGNAYQNAATRADFDFNAEQTTNNP